MTVRETAGLWPLLGPGPNPEAPVFQIYWCPFTPSFLQTPGELEKQHGFFHKNTSIW